MLPVSANFLAFWKSRYAAVQLRILHLKEIWLNLIGRATATASSNTVGNPPENTIDGNLATFLEVQNISSVVSGRYEATDFPENRIFTTWGGVNYFLLPTHDGVQTSPWQIEPTWADDATGNQLSGYIITDAAPFGLVRWDATGFYVLQPSDAGGRGYAHLKLITNNPITHTPRTIVFENEWELRNGTTGTMRFTSGWSITDIRDTAYGDIYLSIHGNGNVELFYRPNRDTSLTSILLATHSLAVGHRVKTRMLSKNGRYRFWLWVDTGTGWVVVINGFEIVLFDFVNLYPQVGSFSPASTTPPQRWLDFFFTGYLRTQAEISGGDTLSAIVGLSDRQLDNRFMGWGLRRNELPSWDMRNGVRCRFLIISQDNRTNFVVRLVDNLASPRPQWGIEITFHNRSNTGSAMEFFSREAGHEIEIVGRMNSDRTTFFGFISNKNLDTNITLSQSVIISAIKVWDQSMTFADGGIGFGCAYYTGESIYASDFYKVLLRYFEISTNHEWLKITLNEMQFVSAVRITFDHANTTPDVLYAVFSGDYESAITIIAPILVQNIPVNRLINEILFYWGTSTSPVRIKEVEIQPSREIDAKNFAIFRRKDFRLDQTLIGESSISTADDFGSFEPNDRIVIQAGFNYEFVNIWTGFIDNIKETLGRQHLSIKMRDAMKPLARRELAPHELVNARLKSILDAICDECGISVDARDFDNPSIFLDYWAPKDVRAVDDVKKLIGATVDSEFYANEDGRLVFRSFLPITKLSELWDTDTDWSAKRTSSMNMSFHNNKLNTSVEFFQIVDTISAEQNWSFLVPDRAVISLISSLDFSFQPSRKIRRVRLGRLKCGYGDGNTPFDYVFVYIRLYHKGVYVGERYIISSTTPILNQVFNYNDAMTHFDWIVDTPLCDRVQIRIGFVVRTMGSATVRFRGQGVASVSGFRIIQNEMNLAALSTIGPLRWAWKIANFAKGIIEIEMTRNADSNWLSATIPTAMTRWDIFEVVDDGSAFSYFLQHSADGITWSPKLYITKNTIPAVPVNNFHRWGVEINTLDIKSIDLVRLNWWVGGGGDRFARPIVLELTGDEIKSATRIKTDEVGGGNAIINAVEVKAQPKYVAGADENVWQGTVEGVPISVANPLVVSTAPITFLLDLKEPISEATQTLQITWSAGGTLTTYTRHATKPTLIINSNGTITDLRITGRRIISDANLTAIASDTASITKYGEARETIDNDYISRIEIARAKADLLIDRFRNPLMLVDMTIIFTPQLQIGDIVRIIYPERNLNNRAYILEIRHEMTAQRNEYTLETNLKVLILPA